MGAYLLLMTFGPVQSFIAQARRTRDLWFGSHVLSELSKDAMEAVNAIPGTEFIFPVLPSTSGQDTGLPNKLLVRVRAGEPRMVAEAARDAARARLVSWGMAQWEKMKELVAVESRAAAQEQLETLLEFQAAWVPFVAESDYSSALVQVEEVIAGRKRLQAFRPWLKQRGGVHKSSLDGARETVLRSRGRGLGQWARYRIGIREELDTVGLLKRTGGKPGQFVPVTSIGLSAFIGHAEKAHPQRFSRLVEACEDLRKKAPQVLACIEDRGREWIHRFPYDAQVLLPDRWKVLLEEEGVQTSQATDFYATHVRPLLDVVGEPYPYVVCLSADGDRMGLALESLAMKGSAAHQSLSRALADFSQTARRVVEQDHEGVLVYAGGDDVLAFVALPRALACASALREEFARATRNLLPSPLTLSVGLGIGHVLESLGDLLDLGRRAEGLAKGTGETARDGLGVVARLHSGRMHSWREQWSSSPGALLALSDAVRLREVGRLPLKKLQEVESLTRRFPSPKAAEPLSRDVVMGSLLAREVGRVLGRVEAGGPDGKGLLPREAGLELEGALTLGEVQSRVSSWVSRVWVAELFSRAEPRPRVDVKEAE
ncbi:type III-B CRISPR-associated protein Cas10/Cmr2 [Corallococcus sp. H22C18031201]|nr:type III-B CRISPR-associated protein Cas10/Cmr2 [Corallococcus sp. H22C18031201]